MKREPSLVARARQLHESKLKKDTELNAPHKRLRRAINDAFKAAGRRLQDYARRQRADIKSRKPLPEARVSTLLTKEGYGFLTSNDGREIYFHKNSLLGHAFPRLKVGTKVTFTEEAGDEGPQASTVRIVPKQGTQQQTEGTAA